MKQKPKVYFENLDGLRFISFLSVFLFHSFHTNFDYIKNSSGYAFVKYGLFKNGNLGVNFFFVLSGFLITFLLLKEKEHYGKIDVISFWKRRIFRIWPLFYFCVLFGFLVFPLLKSFFGQTPNETANPIFYLTFLNNFDFINEGLPDASVLGVLWSIAIEEQFYFVWPLLLSALPARFYPYIFGIVILISLGFRYLHDKDFIYFEFHTLSCMGDLAVGGFGAWLAQSNHFITRIRNLSRIWISVLYILVASIYFFRDEFLFSIHPVRIVERLFIAIVFLMVLLEQNYSANSLFKMKNLKRISELGVITYGLYCLHFIGILIATTITSRLSLNVYLWEVLFLDTLMALLITIFISKLSFKYYELPFLKMNQRISYISKDLN